MNRFASTLVLVSLFACLNAGCGSGGSKSDPPPPPPPPPPAPTVSFSATGTQTVVAHGSLNLNVTATNATSCTYSVDQLPFKVVSNNGCSSVTLIADVPRADSSVDSNVTVTASGNGGTATAKLALSMTIPISTLASGTPTPNTIDANGNGTLTFKNSDSPGSFMDHNPADFTGYQGTMWFFDTGSYVSSAFVDPNTITGGIVLHNYPTGVKACGTKNPSDKNGNGGGPSKNKCTITVTATAPAIVATAQFTARLQTPTDQVSISTDSAGNVVFDNRSVGKVILFDTDGNQTAEISAGRGAFAISQCGGTAVCVLNGAENSVTKIDTQTKSAETFAVPNNAKPFSISGDARGAYIATQNPGSESGEVLQFDGKDFKGTGLSLKKALVQTTAFGFAAVSEDKLWVPDLHGSYKSMQLQTQNANRIALQQPNVVAVSSSGSDKLELLDLSSGTSKQIQLSGRVIHLQNSQGLYVSFFSGDVVAVNADGTVEQQVKTQPAGLLNGFAVSHGRILASGQDYSRVLQIK